MKSLARNLISKINTKAKVLTLTALFMGLVSGAAYAGFSPANRPVFDWNNPSDRQGSLEGPVFNSFVNTPDYGDERAFFDASMTGADGSYEDVLPYVTQDEDGIITLRTYVHNNANQNTNDTIGVAKDTKVRIDLPTGTDTMLRMRSYISASNAMPTEVSDTTELVDTKSFSVEYIPGSAKIYNGNHNGSALSDSIVTTGATIGSDELNGDYLGCFEYASTVEIQVRINPVDVDIEKKVKLSTADTYGEVANAKPGDIVDWAIQMKNSGDATVNNTIVRDVLPPHVQLVPGSIRWIDTRQDATQNDTALFDGGINFGSYAAGADMYVLLKTTVLDNFESCEVTVRNLAYVRTDETPAEINDHADLVITKENCDEPEEPIYSCDALNIFKLDRDTFRFTVNATAENGASIVGYEIDTGVETIKSENATVEYTYAQSGNYDIKASVVVAVNEDQTKGGIVTSENCEGQLTVDQPEEPIYRCEDLKATLVSNRKYRFTVDATAEGGATIKHYVYDFGDDTAELTTDKSTVEHTYAKDGEYAVVVTVVFNVNDQLRSEDCSTIVKVTTPTTPEVLPNTGAGSLVGLMAATTFLGALGYRFVLLRR